MIELSGLSVSYNQARPLRNVTAALGEPFISIVGPSGSGKSTLLRVVAGLQKPDAGEVLVDGVPVKAPSWNAAGDPRVSLVHQDYRLIEFLTVQENLQLATELRAVDAEHDELVSALAKVGLTEDFLGRFPPTLSGGEQQRVAIARSLACKVKVLLADEPTGALDVANTEKVAAVLRDLVRQSDVQVIVATHDPLVASRADVTYALSAGRLETRHER